MGRSFLRRAFSLKNAARLSVVLGLTCLAVAVAKVWWDSRVFEGYDPTLPLDAKIVSSGQLEGHPTEKIEFTGLAGERIPARIIRPASPNAGKVPCVVFLYGIGQNARFFDRIAPIFADRGFAMAMPEQYQCGERRRRGIGVVREVLALRERSSRIVPETRRLVDHLSSLPDIDPAQIYLIGASYGGITGSSVMANEPRISKGALVMAGGDLPRLLVSLARNRKPESRVLAPAAARLAAWFLSPFEPLDYIGKISPRPLLFFNVADDEMIDAACGRMLFEAAGEPKQEKLYGGAHNTISEQVVREMLDEALLWMQAGPQIPQDFASKPRPN